MAIRNGDGGRGWHRQSARFVPGQAAADERARSARLAAMLKFTGHLSTMANETEMVAALLQAAAVWYDLDGRVYRRTVGGTFTLCASLPGASAADAPLDLADSPDVPTRVTSLLDLHHLGWRNPVGDVVLLPIVLQQQPEWLLAVVGPSDHPLESELGSLCGVVGTLFDRLSSHRAAALTTRVASALAGGTTGGEKARALLDELAVAVSASRAVVWVVRSDERPRALASWGGLTEAMPDIGTSPELVGADRIVLTVPAWNRSTAAVDLIAAPETPFTPESLRLARTGADALRIWLAGIQTATAHDGGESVATSSTFEARIGEELDRARQFGLPVSLLIVTIAAAGAGPARSAADQLTEELRGLLRSHDQIGRLERGDIAMLFSETDAQGLRAVLERIVHRIETVARREPFPAVRIGRAVFPAQGESAADLLLQARLGAQVPAGMVM